MKRMIFSFLCFSLLLIKLTLVKALISCSNVKYAYTTKGFDDGDVPKAAISGEHLRICERGLTCCTEEMEHKLSTHSRAEFDKLLHNTIGELKEIFESHTHRFDEFFRELLKVSRRGFHDMFVRTYGQLYEQNAYLFSSMFDDLEKYYATGGVDLEDAMDEFFHRLYGKMFQVLNAQHRFDSRYLECVSEQMSEMKPFGDVPSKLILEIKRSFVATRTFVQALSVGKDVVKSIMEVGPTPECSRALMKMAYCPHCHGLPDLKPCSPYCLYVLNNCLNNHVAFGSEWSSFIDSLINLVSRLENSYNIESVLEPIDIKISEAIMNFQENGVAISKKLFHKCGKPRLGKRDLSDQEIPLEKLKFLHNHGARPTTAAGTSIERLVDNLKKKTKKIKKFWQELPLKMCSHSLMEEGSEGCWDGNTETRNVNASIKHILSFKDSKEPNENPIINQQILTLNLISTKLSHAYKGLDVEWEDSVDSSSGSGSGSGFGNVATSEDFEDLFFSVPRASPTDKVPSSYQTPATTSTGTLKYFSFNVLVLVILIKWALS
ncbi:glypican-6 [Nephila pilipes]|uniref:Glypican-6 n=1 Tax=Nephila pilipes TaxID=299642 RepID=A0A8X6Q8N1_NEPPI|nr:glypican-6 [Nephila pilipes]